MALGCAVRDLGLEFPLAGFLNLPLKGLVKEEKNKRSSSEDRSSSNVMP